MFLMDAESQSGHKPSIRMARILGKVAVKYRPGLEPEAAILQESPEEVVMMPVFVPRLAW